MTGATVAEIRQERLQTARRNIRSGDGNERACRQCGKAITAKWYKKYCSQECCVKSTSEHSQKLYKNNPDKFKKNTRTWQKDNPEKYMESRRRSNEKRRRKAMVARGVIKRTCRQCGKAITTWRRKAYCSQECSVVGRMEYPRKRYANNPEKAIEISRRWRKNNPEKYMESRRRSDEKRRRKAIVARGVIKRTCRQCGNMITAWRRKAYCSQECSVVGRMEYSRKRYVNNPEKAIEINKRWRKNNPEKAMENSHRGNERRRIKAMVARGVIKRICRHCGKAITVWRRRKYCSKECGTKGNKILIRQWQKNNPEKARDISRRRYEKRRKIIKENTERWVENYLAKVREGAKAERDAGRENHDNNNRQQHEAFGSMPTGGEMK